jgi:hypothetical protein
MIIYPHQSRLPPAEPWLLHMFDRFGHSTRGVFSTKLTLAEKELLHDSTVEYNPPVSATQQQSPPLLLLQHPQDQQPQDPTPPHTVRHLALETVEMQQATYSLPLRSPSPIHAANSVG